MELCSVAGNHRPRRRPRPAFGMLQRSSFVLLTFSMLTFDYGLGFLQNSVLTDSAKGSKANSGMPIYWDIDNIGPVGGLGQAIAQKHLHRAEREAGSQQLKNVITKKKLIDEIDCKRDIGRMCGVLSPNADDLDVLECVQSFKGNELVGIEEPCQHIIWRYMMDLLDDANLREASQTACNRDFVTLDKDCKITGHTGSLLACMIDHRDSIKSTSCRAFIQRLEWVAFSDFRIISHFTDDCREDIDRLSCGRLQTKEGRTLACLQQQIEGLGPKCQKQVLHLSEIQADDIKLDRQLYLACREDYSRFCPDMAPGNGNVYKCLMQHKMDRAMTQQCQNQLVRRQRLIAQDYRVSKGLARACKEDIRAYHCRQKLSDDKEIKLAQILLCLEGVIRNGTKVSRDCQAEMIEHRKILMEDYRLSPDLVARCSDDIIRFCNGLEVGGKTIHCLMEHTRPRKKKDRVSAQCQREVEVLLKEVDAGEDWRVDPVLREACKPVVDVACQDVRGGNARVMSCLMEKLGTDHMTEACETALLQIQYFVARDFKLDPQLYRECREDAVRLCHAKRTWRTEGDQLDPERGPLVLPCLYRYAFHPQNNLKTSHVVESLKSSCLQEIRRVMRQRAVSVDLQPEVEEACLQDLAVSCYEKTGKGEEMVCLQDNLENLSTPCKLAVMNFTEVEAERVELNPVIMSTCRGIMDKHCEAELKSGKDEGDIMECLIEHKNEADVRANYKCRAAIEHFQLLSLKNYHFTYKFKEACRLHVVRYCPSAKTKYDVISCLSELVRNDTLKEAKHSIPKECRQQLRAQLFQQRENIDFNPRLQEACLSDIKSLCSEVTKGESQVLECLQAMKSHLSDSCHRAIFNVERQELQDNSVDYTLITTCRHMIRQFCHDVDQSQALDCLKRVKDDTTFEPKCKVIVVRRMIEQNSDYRFNPLLQKGCHPDISKFCSEVVAHEPVDQELDGKVVKCLKNKFRERKLRKDCEVQMAVILKEAALNYQLNPLLAAMCKEEIKKMCPPEEDEEDNSGKVEECLKVAFTSGRIRDVGCKMEVASLIEEAKADIHVDPLLFRACSLDVTKYCSDILQGAGRHIQCLQNVLQDSSKSLQADCNTMLTKRIEMFRNAAILVEPQNLEDLYSQVSRSPSKNYFLLIAFSVLGVIFVSGLFCGRVTRRAIMLKNK